SPIALPSRQPPMAELQVKPVAAARQGRALDVGQRDQKLVAGPAAHIEQLHAECHRSLLRRHGEGDRDVRRREGRLLRAGGRQRKAGQHHESRNRRGRSLLHAHHSTATSVPPGVQPPPSAWNRLVAASSLFSRTSTRLFCAVNKVCSACSTVIRLMVPPCNCFSATSKACCEALTTSCCSRSCWVNFCRAISAFSTSEKADSTALR